MSAPGTLKALLATDFDEGALARQGLDVEIRRGGWGARRVPYTPEEIVETVNREGIHFLVVEVEEVPATVFRGCPDLAVVASMRANPVNVDLEAAADHGVVVLHAPGRNAQAVAELALALMLNLFRRVIPAHLALLAGGWGAGEDDPYLRFRGRELHGKTVGLVGLGAIGQRLAGLLSCFEAELLAYDPFVGQETFDGSGATPVSLGELLARADALSIHIPLNDSTRGMLGAAQLRRMKPEAILINTARADVVDRGALFQALTRGWIAGAGLDVFDREPPDPSDPLLQLPNVISTPHIGGATEEVILTGSEIVAADLARLLSGRTPRHAAALPELARWQEVT